MVRRVVTGHTQNGRAIFVADGEVDPVQLSLLPGVAYHLLWGADLLPEMPDDGALPIYDSYFPPRGGFRFSLYTMPAARSQMRPQVDGRSGYAEMERLLPGLAAHMDRFEPGMHTSATVDLEVILSGEFDLELDDGAVTRLLPGDVVVQNGTRHRWSNPGNVPATMAVFMIGVPHTRLEAGREFG
jgi:hypothetical protein